MSERTLRALEPVPPVSAVRCIGDLPTSRRLAAVAAAMATAALLVPPVTIGVREAAGRWFHVFLVATLSSFALVPASMAVARLTGALDLPDRRKVHTLPTPRLGGLAVVTGIALALAANGLFTLPLTALLGAALGLMTVGVLDDVRGLPASVRLAAQVLAATGVVASGVVLKVLPAWWSGSFEANVLITMLWLVGITNAFNFFDGMDGLAPGLAAVLAGFMGYIALSTGQAEIGWISVAVVGACLGFLPDNARGRRPARVFLGDGGSTALGFLLAGLAVHGEWAAGNPVANLAAPLLVFGVLIFDMIHTTVSRIARGDVRTVRQWLEYTGRDHMHHRFEALLRSKGGAVLLVQWVAVTLGLNALLLRHTAAWGAVLLLFQAAAILLAVTILEHAGNRRERRRAARGANERFGAASPD